MSILNYFCLLLTNDYRYHLPQIPCMEVSEQENHNEEFHNYVVVHIYIIYCILVAFYVLTLAEFSEVLYFELVQCKLKVHIMPRKLKLLRRLSSKLFWLYLTFNLLRYRYKLNSKLLTKRSECSPPASYSEDLRFKSLPGFRQC